MYQSIHAQVTRYKLHRFKLEHLHVADRYSGGKPKSQSVGAGAGLLLYTGEGQLDKTQIINTIIANDIRAQSPDVIVSIVAIDKEQEAEIAERAGQILLTCARAESQEWRFAEVPAAA